MKIITSVFVATLSNAAQHDATLTSTLTSSGRLILFRCISRKNEKIIYSKTSEHTNYTVMSPHKFCL